MAMLVHATEPVDQPSWDIQNDAFAPPPTRRIVRGWDRAPVSARAPRLHGQKVWKKVGLKPTNIEDTQNEAQEELEKEGAGARKKSRMLTSRENINDAMWAERIHDKCTEDIGSKLGPNEEQSEKLSTPGAPATDGSDSGTETPFSNNNNAPNTAEQDSAMPNLQFIPRKRTNTDHVITPKKPLRQTILEYKEQIPSVNEKPNSIIAKIIRPRKSLRKSMITSMPENAPEPTTSKAQARLSSSAEYLQNNEHSFSGRKKSKESTGNQRVLRRSTISTRRSIAHAEQSSIILHNPSQSTELSPHDATDSIVTISANSTIPSQNVIPTGPDEDSVTGDTATGNTTDPNPLLPLDIEPGRERSACPVTPTFKAELPGAVQPQLPEVSSNDGEYNQQMPGACIEEDISNSKGTTSGESGRLSERQKSLSELPNPEFCSAIEGHLITCQDTSKANMIPLAEHASLSVSTGIASSPGPGREVPQTESTISSEAPVELDVNHDHEKIEAHEAREASNLALVYDHDDTDMLRNFLTRVKANKAAKNPPKRKRSLPHSPLRIPLGDLDNNASPSPLQLDKGGELDVVEPSPSRRKKKPGPLAQCENEPEPRRSGRTKPPVKEPPGVPSFIPVRRLGQDIETTLTLKRNEEKELAALTRVNTRKNKGNALTALEVLAKKSEEKEDPVMRQRLLKEVFDEKLERGRQDKEKKGREMKKVTWAEELAQFQTLTKGKAAKSSDDKENEKAAAIQGGEDKKQGAVRVGVRSKAALGMALNGTPAPKRKMRGRV